MSREVKKFRTRFHESEHDKYMFLFLRHVTLRDNSYCRMRLDQFQI